MKQQMSVAIVTQHANSRRHIVFSSESCPAPLYFSEKKVIHYKIYFGFLYGFILNISHCKKNLAGYFHKCKNIFM
jgi:hypothetical protein